MAAALKALLDKRSLALTRAKLRAWWEGEEFDESAALAAIEAELATVPANENDGDADDALFDAPAYELPPRLKALEIIWGKDRIRPGDSTADKLDPAAIGLAPDGVLAVLGPGLIGPLGAVAAAHPGPIEAFEWREETLGALKAGIARSGLNERIKVSRIDVEAFAISANAYDALLSTDDFAYCSHPPHLAQKIAKGLKPNGRAVVESYVGFRAAEFATAFATSFAEPAIEPHGDLLAVLGEAGLLLEADEDITEAFLETTRGAFKQLSERLATHGELEPAVARELAWEAEAWRMRIKLLAQRRLERRRFILRKPREDEDLTPAAAAEAPAPPAEGEPDLKYLEVLERVRSEKGKGKS